MKIKHVSQLKSFSKELNQRKTRAEIYFEKVLKKRFKGKGNRLDSQKVIGFYIVDLFYKKRNLVIEIDGSIHDTPEQKFRDMKKDRFLKNMGFNVVRFKNIEVFKETAKCLEIIASYPVLTRSKFKSALPKAAHCRERAIKNQI